MPLLALAVGCVASPLDSGEWGAIRYFADVLGDVPLPMIPPLTDRQGNTYVLYGAPGLDDVTVSRLSVTGNRPTACDPNPSETDPGTSGLHGFVGRTLDRVWYWTGTALVEVKDSGSCEFVLGNDPVSGTEVRFLGVAPYVDDTPSRRFATALVGSGTGEFNFTLVDLDRGLPFNSEPFPSDDPRELRVVGTGVWEAERTTVFIVAFSSQVQAFFLDRLGDVVARRDVALPKDIAAYDVEGFLQFNDAGYGAGLLSDGRILTLRAVAESAVIEPDFTALGLLTWQGELYVTGERDGQAVLARVESDRELTAAIPFDAAARAADGLREGRFANDERSRPLRRVPWDTVRTAIGTRPLITPWPLDPHTVGSVGWVVAGPAFATGVDPVTAVGFSPVGLEVP